MKTISNPKIGETIRKYRRDNNLTQKQLADMLGIQSAAISKYEKGLIYTIPLLTREKLAQILKIPRYNLELPFFSEEDHSYIMDEVIDTIAESMGNIPSYAENDNYIVINKSTLTAVDLECVSALLKVIEEKRTK